MDTIQASKVMTLQEWVNQDKTLVEIFEEEGVYHQSEQGVHCVRCGRGQPGAESVEEVMEGDGNHDWDCKYWIAKRAERARAR